MEFCRQQIARLKDGLPPLVDPTRLSARFPVLDLLIASNKDLPGKLDSLGPPLLLTSKYLDIPRTLPAFIEWLREKSDARSAINDWLQKVHRLHEAILLKLEESPASAGSTAPVTRKERPSRAPKPRGRRPDPDYDPEEDRRIYEGWQAARADGCRTINDFKASTRHKLEAEQIREAIDRHRKRIGKAPE